LIGNVKNFINKKANQSTMEMYYRGKTQEPKLQWSIKNRKGKTRISRQN